MGSVEDELRALRRSVRLLGAGLAVMLVAFVALAAWVAMPRALVASDLVVRGSGGARARLSVDGDGRAALAFDDGHGAQRLELWASPGDGGLNLHPVADGSEDVFLTAGRGSQLRLRSGDRSVAMMTSRGSIAQIQVQGLPGVYAELGLGLGDTPQLNLSRGEAATGGGVTNVHLASQAEGAQLDMARIVNDEHGTTGKRADLWAGYPGGDAGAALELRDAGADVLLHTATKEGGPRLEAQVQNRRLWAAP